MSEVAEIQNTPKPKLLEKLGNKYGIEPNRMLNTLKATAFKTRNQITNEQMVALLVVADQYDLNPWTREIYAFPDKHGGIVPVVGVDGWSRIINSHNQFDGMDYEYSAEMVSSESNQHKPCPEWVKCIMYRKDRAHPVVVQEYFDECYRGPMGSPPKPGPWQTHPKRFLRHKATIQCARLAFGFVGIFDPDEAERIVEAEVVSVQPKSTSVTQTVIDDENIQVDESALVSYVDALKEAVYNMDDMAINQLYGEMSSDMELCLQRRLSSQDRSYIKKARHGDADERTEPTE